MWCAMLPWAEEMKGSEGTIMRVRYRVCTQIDSVEVTLNPKIGATCGTNPMSCGEGWELTTLLWFICQSTSSYLNLPLCRHWDQLRMNAPFIACPSWRASLEIASKNFKLTVCARKNSSSSLFFFTTKLSILRKCHITNWTYGLQEEEACERQKQAYQAI